MTILQTILLGIVQGLTEFLPISSSAHLVLVPYLLGWKIPADEAFIFDVLVQVATLVAVFAYYWKDVKDILIGMWSALRQRELFANPQARLGWNIVVATLPAGILGLLLKDQVEAAFNSPTVTAVFLLGTAGLLIFAERAGKQNLSIEHLTWIDAVFIGFYQAIAIFPGISRSGSTITGGMARNLNRPSAARFSFLMSMPIMLAAGLLATKDLIGLPNLGSLLPVFIPGFIVSAITGYLAIRWLISYLVHHSLVVFAIYCVALALLVLAVNFIR
jgi:undecaprenyl-diphosphatase